MNPLLELRNMTKRYGDHVVFERVSLTIESGAHLALVGPSGCGKSTLLRLIAGLDTPTEGELLIHGVTASLPDRTVQAPHERGVAMVFQDLALWPNLTALENVRLGLAGQSLANDERRDRAATALTSCEIASLADRLPGTLSIGQQQRVALARALAVRPKLLLFDEPFSSLDVTLKAQLFITIRDLAAETGATFVLVTHDPLEASALASDIAVLEDRALCEHGPLSALLAAPRSRTLAAFASSLNAATNPVSN